MNFSCYLISVLSLFKSLDNEKKQTMTSFLRKNFRLFKNICSS